MTKVSSKRRAQMKEWRKNNKERSDRINRKAYLKRVYGITPEEYNQMFLEQKGCCAICGKHQSLLKRRLAVDHCHNSLKVRGLLCHTCNKALGFYEKQGRQFEEYLSVYA